jgi:hypothetical protein
MTSLCRVARSAPEWSRRIERRVAGQVYGSKQKEGEWRSRDFIRDRGACSEPTYTLALHGVMLRFSWRHSILQFVAQVCIGAGAGPELRYAREQSAEK